MPRTLIEDVACTVCGCVCDDLRVTLEQGRIVKAEGACHLAEPWFLSQDAVQPPAAEMDGAEVPVGDALDRAAELLQSARAPLVYGLSRSSTAGQREAVHLADWIGGNIDTTASLCHAPSIMAIQEVGESTCSLGEIRNRADLVLFWGVNPAQSHPRHWERYSVDPAGMFLPRGRADRHVVVLDSEPNESSRQADRFIQLAPGLDFEVLWTLRCLVAGIAIERPAPRGVPIEQLQELAARMKTCRCGVVFFGLGLAQRQLGHRNVAALLQLVRDLNAHTRFHARRMRMLGDVTGADSVLCWQTGFPFSVNLQRGFPRYNPGEYSAADLLERSEVDAALVVGSETIEQMSEAAQATLARIPTIVLDHPTVRCAWPPTVRFTTAVYGIHLPGTAYRMDEVPIPLRALLPAAYASDAEILKRIRERIGACHFATNLAR